MKRAPVIFTVGHSTRSIEEFIAVLKAYQIEEVADVRTIPRSRHNPQFNLEELPGSLGKEGIGYIHMKGLGGLRHSLAGSPNTGWRNLSFRGFSDYMQTGEFRKNVGTLIQTAKKKRIALMCAEAVPWRCHRSLIADALSVCGIEVIHISSTTSHHTHALTLFAKVRGTRITYPPEVLR